MLIDSDDLLTWLSGIRAELARDGSSAGRLAASTVETLATEVERLASAARNPA